MVKQHLIGEWVSLPGGRGRYRVVPWPLVSDHTYGWGVRRDDGPRHVSGLVNQRMAGHRKRGAGVEGGE